MPTSKASAKRRRTADAPTAPKRGNRRPFRITLCGVSALWNDWTSAGLPREIVQDPRYFGSYRTARRQADDADARRRYGIGAITDAINHRSKP